MDPTEVSLYDLVSSSLTLEVDTSSRRLIHHSYGVVPARGTRVRLLLETGTQVLHLESAFFSQ